MNDIELDGTIGVENIDLVGIYDGWLDQFSYDYSPVNIGMSKLGSCPKKICLEMSCAKKKEKTLEEEENSRRMFRVANLIEDDYRKAFEEKRLLFGYQSRMTEWLPEGWGGFLDFLIARHGEFSVVELKTTRSNNFRYTNNFPKKAHVLQASGYCMALSNLGIVPKNMSILYVDRGGSNRSIEIKIPYTKKQDIVVLKEMNILMSAWKKYQKENILPNTLDRYIEIKYNKKEKKAEGFLTQSWECSYCDFESVSCKPDMSRNKVGEYKDKLVMRKGYEEYQKEFLNALKNKN